MFFSKYGKVTLSDMPQQWFTLKRNATVHHLVPISKSIVVDLQKLLGVSFQWHICVFRKGEPAAWHYSVAGIDSVAKFILRKTLKTNINEKILRDWKVYAKKLELLFKKIERVNVKKISDKGLIALYNNVLEALALESALGTMSDFLDSELVPQTIKKYLKKIKAPADMIEAAVTSLYSSPYIKEQEDFFKLADFYSKGKNINKQLQTHAEKYWYLQNDYSQAVKLDVEHFKTQIQKYLKEKGDPKEELQLLANKRSTLVSKKRSLMRLARVKKQKEFLKILKMLDIHIYLWDLKKVMMQKAFYYLDLLLIEIGTRRKVKFNDLKWCTPEEVRVGKTTKQLRDEIKKRKTLCVLEIVKKGTIKVITGPQAKKKVSRIEGKTLGDVAELKGQVANRGKVQGRVRVVLDPRGVKFKQGDILVTGMTTPDFMPLMRKASAIVTDEGGITCHAAIVSRELGIPCVIGTKIGTKVLKNGENIAVDANGGIVKVLKK